MHDSEQEHSGITGCRVTYESTIFYNEANKFSIIVVKTNDPRIPLQVCSDRYYGDRMLRFTAVGYELPRTKAVELELDGEWVESKYGYDLIFRYVSVWHCRCSRTAGAYCPSPSAVEPVLKLPLLWGPARAAQRQHRQKRLALQPLRRGGRNAGTVCPL